jgi:hypothetical protein
MKKTGILAFIIFTFLLINPAVRVFAQASTVTLEVSPGTLDLYPQGEADIVLILRNNTSGIISNLEISTFGTADIEPPTFSNLPATLPAGSSLAIPAHLIRGPKGYRSGTLIFLLKYQTLGQSGSPAAPGVVTATLGIKEQDSLSLDKVIDVKVTTPLTVLSENQHGIIRVTVRNLAYFPVTVTNILPGGTRFIDFNSPSFAQSVEIPPQTSQVYDFTATLKSPYQIGTEPLYFTVSIQWNQDGYTFTGSQAVMQPISIGVFSDQSDLLKVLGLPSFLLLPGFLVVVAVIFCWKRISPKTDPALAPTNVEFWILAVTLSIPLIFIYRGGSILVNHPRQFPDVFGLVDILILWVASLAIGILGWALILWVRRYLKRFVPLPDDSPLRMIYKLVLNQSGIYLDQAILNDRRYLKFPPISDAPGKTWLLPYIEYEFTPSALHEDEFKKGLTGILARVQGAKSIDTVEGARELHQKLTEGIRKKMIVVKWGKGERPAAVEDSKYKPGDRSSLVRQKENGNLREVTTDEPAPAGTVTTPMQ